MLQRQTMTARYWTESLKLTDADIELLFGIMLEDEKPLSSRALAQILIENRIRAEEDMWRSRLGEGALFQPKNSYEIGQKLVFPALDFALGEIVDTRPGASPDHGEFTVVAVAFPDGIRREFATELPSQHVLNLDTNGNDVQQLLGAVDPAAIMADYGEEVITRIEAHFAEEEDVAYSVGLWFLKSLLPTVNEGHLNLAEAVLDMSGGGPASVEDILAILDLPKEINAELQGFAVNCALYEDARFDEVGPAREVRWYLQRAEPEEVHHPPERLVYDPIPYDESLLSATSRELIADIRDEFSPLPPPEQPPEAVTLTLIYPHRRMGTLPLNAELSSLFPTSLESRRIRITLVDGKTGDEYEGWVVREARYVFGLERFYRTHKLPIGVYIHVRSTEDPSRFLIDFDGYRRARTEWIRLVMPQDGRLVYQNNRRSIGAAYDDLMVLGTDDLEAVDEIWDTARKQRHSLVRIIRETLPELARLSPQGTAHAKTIYSAVNVVRRVPTEPILAALESGDEFEYVGDHYWRLK